MDDNQQRSLFGLSIDTDTSTRLAAIARWAVFLSSTGFILCGLIILTGLFAGIGISSSTAPAEATGNSSVEVISYWAGVFLFYVIVFVFFFSPVFTSCGLQSK